MLLPPASKPVPLEGAAAEVAGLKKKGKKAVQQQQQEQQEGASPRPQVCIYE
jgi:hypothetical protein